MKRLLASGVNITMIRCICTAYGLALFLSLMPYPVSAEVGVALHFSSDDASVVLRKKPRRRGAIFRYNRAPVIKRYYDTSRSIVVIERAGGVVDELPYIGLPVHFVKGSAELLNQRSGENVEKLAWTLESILREDHSARFDIQGHASSDGSSSYNFDLSQRRARRIQWILVNRYNVPRLAVSGTGFGEQYARYPANAPEHLLRKDRRVLVVRYQ